MYQLGQTKPIVIVAKDWMAPTAVDLAKLFEGKCECREKR